MDWEIFRTAVKFDVVRDKPLIEGEVSNAAGGMFMDTLMYPDKHVLYRSDTSSPLSVVSSGYNIVQPLEVLEFYRDLVDTAGLELETAGVLFGGRRFFALANTEKMAVLPGDDKVKGYLLLTTSCDGTLATTAQFTSVRVVCNNTLSVAVKDNNTRIKVPHNRVWKPSEVKEQLGFIDQGWNRFSEQIGILAEKTVERDKAVEYLIELFGDPTIGVEDQNPAVMQKCANVWALFKGEGMGSKLPSAEDTMWGLLNSITETIDHHTGHRTTDARMNSAWLGEGNNLKSKAFELALTI
jgi:phage/plasmid-like protein (TIGR03299 family)